MNKVQKQSNPKYKYSLNEQWNFVWKYTFENM
jgi:hypothetical protein